MTQYAIVGLVLAGAVVVALVKIVKHFRNRGKNDCNCGCDDCSLKKNCRKI